MRVRRLILPALALALAGWAAFTARKAWEVARELTDPPFYRPQPLARVEATYSELARGQDGDPGGTWKAEDVQGLQLWTLRRTGQPRGVVLLLHGFGDDRWGTSPALKWFPTLDAAIFTYRRRDDILRKGFPAPPITFGVREQEDVVTMVHHLESRGWRRDQILLMGRSLGASVGLLALGRLGPEVPGPPGGRARAGPPAPSRPCGERLVRGPKDRFWHGPVAPLAGWLGSQWAGRIGRYDPAETDLLVQCPPSFQTPSLCFLASQDRLADPAVQRRLADRFQRIRVLEVETWHLNAAAVLGPRYAEAIRAEVDAWMK